MRPPVRIPSLAARTLGAAVVLLWALPALAAEAEHAATAMDLVLQGINLAVLLAIIVYFGRKPIARFFRGTAAEVKRGYDDTRQSAEETLAELEAQKKRLEGLEAELGRMVQGAREDAAVEHEALLAEAANQAERIKAQSRQQVEQEMNKARSELRAQLADETVKLAEDTLKSRMDEKRQKELLADYVDQIGAGS